VPQTPSEVAPPFRRITIVGIGLIGGSLSLAIKKRFPPATVTGVDTPAVLRAAQRLKVIDRATTNVPRAVEDAELVVLAVPVGTILNLLMPVAQSCQSSVIVIDTGSVKDPIVRQAARLFPSGNFIGGHPMAGSEQSGVEAARADLFQGAAFVLCPPSRRSRSSTRKLERFIAALGAIPVVMDAKRHDRIVATLSHLPQLVAVGLANVAGQVGGLRLSGGGLRDLTRLASSPFDLWKDILTSNTANVQEALRALQEELSGYEKLLQENDMGGMRRKFAMAKRIRAAIVKQRSQGQRRRRS
jgi:prephenate dehydrogenase